MTINTVSGSHFLTTVFSNGQLYVACLRVTSRKNLKILIAKWQGENVIIQKSFNRNWFNYFIMLFIYYLSKKVL
jgi:hypothetical protein